MFELLPKNLYLDFVGKRYWFMAASTIAVIVSLVLIIFVQPNWSIDFTGGTEVQFKFQQQVPVSEVRGALAPMGIEDDAIQQVGPDTDSRYLVRLQGKSSANQAEVDAVRSALSTAFGASWIEELRVDEEVGTRASVTYTGDVVPIERVQAAVAALDGVTVQPSTEENTFYLRLPGVAEEIEKALEQKLQGKPFEVERTDSVGPKVGGNLRAAGLISMFVTMGLLLVYVAIRFDFAFAPGAILSLFHDAVITMGIFVLTRQEFGLSMISAILTLLGTSINDTIVIYDRIRENMEKYRKADTEKLVNDSINETLARTITTNGVTGLALIPFLVWGGPVLQQFATAMLIGIVIGSYSTIYVASPAMIIIKENQDKILRVLGLGGKPPSGAASNGTQAKSP